MPANYAFDVTPARLLSGLITEVRSERRRQGKEAEERRKTSGKEWRWRRKEEGQRETDAGGWRSEGEAEGKD
eukprot:759053-Hanusia_phi.AAC.1